MSKVVGIVAEYNPFHNGHYYHIKKSKEISKADYCIAIISGNFTQRGEVSIVNKWAKAYMAICGGADLVIELPTVYSISSAENFANGAIKILDELKIVDTISFGTETDDIEALDNIANVLCKEPKDYVTILNHEIKKGISYPAARENAILMYLNDIKRYANILSGSNNILAIEYLKAIKKQKSNLKPVAVKRKDVDYKEEKIVNNFASATYVRKLIEEQNYELLKKVIPVSSYKILAMEAKKGHIVYNLNKYEKEIIYTLRKMSTEEIASLPDVTEGLENSIKSAACSCNNINDLIEKVKSKRYTKTRIQRILLYALLEINKKTMESSKKNIPYVRVLGFTSKGRKLISEIVKENPKINMITSVKKYVELNNKRNNKEMLEMLSKDIFATDVYTLGYEEESQANLDYTNNMIITN